MNGNECQSHAMMDGSAVVWCNRFLIIKLRRLDLMNKVSQSKPQSCGNNDLIGHEMEKLMRLPAIMMKM